MCFVFTDIFSIVTSTCVLS